MAQKNNDSLRIIYHFFEFKDFIRNFFETRNIPLAIQAKMMRDCADQLENEENQQQKQTNVCHFFKWFKFSAKNTQDCPAHNGNPKCRSTIRKSSSAFLSMAKTIKSQPRFVDNKDFLLLTKRRMLCLQASR